MSWPIEGKRPSPETEISSHKEGLRQQRDSDERAHRHAQVPSKQPQEQGNWIWGLPARLNLKGEPRHNEGHLLREMQRREEEHRKIVEDLRCQLDTVCTRLDDQSHLLAARTAELQQCQTYLSMMDEVSDGDVRRQLSRLNSEVFQTAALLAEEFKFHRSRLDPTHPKIQPSVNRLQPLLGSDLLKLLGAILHDETPLAIQMAVQASMVAYMTRWINRWNLPHVQGDVVNQCLRGIYEEIIQKEGFLIARRWQALTRAHSGEPDLRPDAAAFCQNTLEEYLLDILRVADAVGSEAEIKDRLQSLKERTTAVVEAAFILRDVMGGQVLSCEFEVVTARAEMSFNPTHMHVAYGKAEPQRTEGGAVGQRLLVLCPIQFGLRCRSAVQSGNSVARWTITEKPHVALTTFATELMDQYKKA
ncbi:hypothetical protein K474DRAFT_1640078 [Panus rudis PR-1116 ss-1]|nr:hypothetical protein K474DRAFT_1640078 [Panus rudis PR-1116 ss-1]